MSKRTTGRKRDAASTRAAILASARNAFARTGYDGVGVREIAAGADVTAMMVNRYFGSKAALFEEVVAGAVSHPTVLRDEVVMEPQDPLQRGHSLATSLLAWTAQGTMAIDGFDILQRSAGNAFAMRVWREQIERHHLRRLADILPGPDATERAALVLSVVAGFQLMRQVVGLGCLGSARSDVVEAALIAVMQALTASGPGQDDTQSE